MKPVIALDIDDVLVDTMTALFDHYNQTYGTTLTEQHYYSKDPIAHGVSDYTEAVKRFEKYLASDAPSQLQPFPQAVEAVRRLGSGFTIIAVTSRPSFMQELTVEWAKQHSGNTISQIRFTHFILSPDEARPEKKVTKTDVCRELDARYMIEDHLHHAIPAAEAGVEVFLMDRPWNQIESLPANIYRVTNWQFIEKQL